MNIRKCDDPPSCSHCDDPIDPRWCPTGLCPQCGCVDCGYAVASVDADGEPLCRACADRRRERLALPMWRQGGDP